MAKLTIAFGVLLIVLGVTGFVMTGAEHYTALIPAVFGLIFAVLGALALNPGRRKHAMHAAAMFGVLGFLGTMTGVVKAIKWAAGTAPERQAAVVSQAIMSILCVGFVALCVRSFIQARRARESAPAFPLNPSS